MENVVALRPRERVRLDSQLIATIYRNLGASAADQLVTRALGELALTMAGLAAQLRAHEMGDVVRQLRRLQQIGDNLGMVSLALVSADLRLCLDRGDVTGFSAVWARLMRIAEAALAIEKDALDHSQS